MGAMRRNACPRPPAGQAPRHISVVVTRDLPTRNVLIASTHGSYAGGGYDEGIGPTCQGHGIGGARADRGGRFDTRNPAGRREGFAGRG